MHIQAFASPSRARVPRSEDGWVRGWPTGAPNSLPHWRAAEGARAEDSPCLSNPFLLLFRYDVNCQSSELAKDIVAPSFDPKNKHCVFQGDLLLFSCAGAHARHRRICPCRDFIKGQVALCKDGL